MIHKTLFASASFWMLLQLCCLLVVAKSTQNDQAVLLLKRGKQDLTASNAESEHSLAGAIPDQHLSFLSQSSGYGSFPQSATPFKDHLKGTYASHSIKEAGKELQKEGHVPMAYHQHLPSSSNRYALDDASTEGFLDQVQDLWSVPFPPAHDLEKAEHKLSHSEKGQGSDKKAKEPVHQLTRGQRRKVQEDKESHKAKRTKENRDGKRVTWKMLVCGNELLLKQWREYDNNALKMFMERARSTLTYGDTLKEVLERSINRPSTWFRGVLDHPSILVEDRRPFLDNPTLRDAVTIWAATARDELAQERGGYLDYTEKVDGTWRMKPLDKRCVMRGPDKYKSIDKR